jgi:hypothetical protein
MNHNCHAHGCGKPVPPKMLFCGRHWYTLRRAMRDAVWREYTTGQEKTKDPTFRYLAVQQRAVAEVAFDEARRNGKADATEIARPYFKASSDWREKAIIAGHGDPLEGLAAQTRMRA